MVKLEYSIDQPYGFSEGVYYYVLYKFDDEKKCWDEIKRHEETGEYSYKDKHVYQEEFNHYKVTALSRSGEKIAESRIVSIYPPRPNLNIEPEGE